MEGGKERIEKLLVEGPPLVEPLAFRPGGGRALGLPLRIRQRTSTYVSIRQTTHTSAYVSIFWASGERALGLAAYVSIRQHTSAYVSLRQHTSAAGELLA